MVLIMENELLNGYSEVTVNVRRTIQVEHYEPLVCNATIRRMVKEDGSSPPLTKEFYANISEMAVEIEDELMEFFGIKE